MTIKRCASAMLIVAMLMLTLCACGNSSSNSNSNSNNSSNSSNSSNSNSDIASTTRTTAAGTYTTTEKPQFTCTISSVTAAPGETICVPVMLTGNPGIWGFKIEVGYNHDKLALTALENGTVYVGDEAQLGDITAENAVFAGEYTALDSNNLNNGTLFTMQFKVSESAKVGEVIDLTYENYDPDDVFNVSFEEPRCTLIAGTVTIE